MPQQLLIYEFVTGGGFLTIPGRPLPGGSLVEEGAAMLQAVVSDLVEAELGSVSALRDSRVMTKSSIPGCQWIDVDDAEQLTQRLTSSTDISLVIAPEFDRHLADACRLVRPASRLLLNSAANFIDWTASKSRTNGRLASSGIPCPAAIELCTAEQSSAAIAFPVVVKPDDGAGSQDIKVLATPSDWDDAYHDPRWHVERLVPGRAASVAALCGPNHIEWLTPCWQHVSVDDGFQLHGASLITDPKMQLRAQELVRQSESLLVEAFGYIGVDIVLGTADDGADDCVIEINPRLTSSYPLLSQSCRTNLAEALYQIARGERRTLEFSWAGG